MKTALHSVSYAGVWPGQTRLSLDDFLTKARQLGFDAVMLMAKRPHLSVLDYDAAARHRLRERLAERNLSLACLAGYTDFCMGADRPDIPLREMQIAYVRELCRLAHDLGCGLVRIFTGFEQTSTSFDQQWIWCVESLRECARFAASLDVSIGVQNHHDLAVHWESLLDLLTDINEPNCKAMFDAWAPALQGSDATVAVKEMAPFLVHTTVADYVRRPRFRYQPPLVNYAPEADAIRAVPMGEGFIDYRGFFRALREVGYQGYVAYEMCSPLRGGGGEENLDRCARQFLRYMAEF
ncbi:MAG TPA: sugar phosphate isomerase/epimerase family protein [Gemmataceae bacterium]|nr:sugar phosphate isomerase/epimerase family protein [Gemmataceae bacterium]